MMPPMSTADVYICPAGKTLTTTGARVNGGATLRYRGSSFDCRPCEHKDRCCPKTPARKIPRSIHERARDVARALSRTPAFAQSTRERQRREMRFAHRKRIRRLGRLRLQGPSGARDEFLLAATAQIRGRRQSSSPPSRSIPRRPEAMRMTKPAREGVFRKKASAPTLRLRSNDFFNEIGQKRTSEYTSLEGEPTIWDCLRVWWLMFTRSQVVDGKHESPQEKSRLDSQILVNRRCRYR
jgi:Transposase DDE domain